MNINSLPEEILETIFSYLSPYKEYDVAARVCKTWKRIIYGMATQLPFKFEHDLASGNIDWYSVIEDVQPTSVTPRTGHSICYNDFMRSMYVFGGKSIFQSGAGFNDLLQLDLHLLVWKRPTTKGSLPPPKFGCSLSSYKHFLILFGGSFLPPVNTLNRGTIEYSSDLHFYNLKDNIWTYKPFLSNDSPKETYMPKSCIIADHDDCELDVMLLYGGSTNSIEKLPNKELWCLHLSSWHWEKQVVIIERESESFDLSKVLMNELKSSTYSSSVLVLGQSRQVTQPLLWMMYRTGHAEWTVQQLIISSDNPILVSNINYDMPCLVLGKTLAIFQNTCSERILPLTSRVAGQKVLRSNTYRKDSSSPVPSTPLRQTTSRTSINSLTMPVYSKLFVYLLDLNRVETDGIVKSINQIDQSSGKLSTSFVGLGISSNVLAVIGRGEIILHCAIKSAKRSFMSLSVVRSKR